MSQKLIEEEQRNLIKKLTRAQTMFSQTISRVALLWYHLKSNGNKELNLNEKICREKKLPFSLSWKTFLYGF
jgi:hypothetical protein